MIRKFADKYTVSKLVKPSIEYSFFYWLTVFFSKNFFFSMYKLTRKLTVMVFLLILYILKYSIRRYYHRRRHWSHIVIRRIIHWHITLNFITISAWVIPWFFLEERNPEIRKLSAHCTPCIIIIIDPNYLFFLE